MPNVSITAIAPVRFATANEVRTVTYSPARPLPATRFPLATGKDYNQQTRMILEKWRRAYPLVPYSQLKFTLDNPSSPPIYTTPTGTSLAGGTLIDPLYGEAIPSYSTNPVEDPVLQVGGQGASTPKKFLDPVSINIALRRDAKRTELRQWGFDKIRDAIATIPLAALDQLRVIVRIGDEFQWGRERFTVMQWVEAGYWKNSTSAFFIVMNCQSVTRGA